MADITLKGPAFEKLLAKTRESTAYTITESQILEAAE